ncbi:hypothetical protein ATY30_11220 [Sinorhizobium americanum]|nr:hypothetical protein ATY30_11220 [Sinorhizobium americanum]
MVFEHVTFDLPSRELASQMPAARSLRRSPIAAGVEFPVAVCLRCQLALESRVFGSVVRMRAEPISKHALDMRGVLRAAEVQPRSMGAAS